MGHQLPEPLQRGLRPRTLQGVRAHARALVHAGDSGDCRLGGSDWGQLDRRGQGGARWGPVLRPWPALRRRDLSWIEFAAMLGVEYYRNTELDTEKRLYPGGVFDPLGFADSEQVDRLKEAEIKHARFAMVSMFGMGTQALLFNTGALESLTKFGNLY